MVRSLNKVQLIGNVGREPESRFTQNGNNLTHFSIATSKTWTDQSTNQRRDRTEWHNIVCWGRLGEVASQYLHKGSQVYVEGELQTRSYDRDGQTHHRTEVNCRELIMLGRSDASAGPGSTQYDRPSPTGGSQQQRSYDGNRREQQPQRSYDQGRYNSNKPQAEAESPSDIDDDLPF